MNDNLSNFIHNEVLTRPNHLKDELCYDGKEFNHRTDFKYITQFIDNFLESEEINRYLVLPGLRDVGKSTILFQVYEYLLKEKNVGSNKMMKNVLLLTAQNV